MVPSDIYYGGDIAYTFIGYKNTSYNPPRKEDSIYYTNKCCLIKRVDYANIKCVVQK